MNTNVSIFGAVPDQHPAETKQFERVVDTLISALRGQEPWVVILRDFRYRHSANPEIPGDVDWKGQYDLILLTEHRIVAYELKAYRVDLRYATTTGQPWKIKRFCSDSAELRGSPFDQASRQRAHLIRQFLEQFREPCGIGEMEFIVDSRVVFHEGSNVDGFFYRIPMKENSAEFEEEVISLISDESDREFVRFAFSGPPLQVGQLRRRKLSKQRYDRLKGIYSRYGIEPRTAKWFRVITESEIVEDLEGAGSEEMTLTEACVLRIARASALQLARHEILD